jgi:type I restriction enzyme S subunit
VVHGATGIVPPALDGAIVSNEYLTAVDGERLITEFLTILAGLPAMRRKFFLSSYGVDIEKLFFDVGDWKKRSIAVPSVAEQISINSLFSKLDELVELYQLKHARTVSVREAMLQRMLPRPGATEPEVRFNGFKDKWGQKRFVDFFEYERPDKYIVAEAEYSSEHKVPVLTANKAFILGYTNESRTFNKPCLIFDDFTLEAKYVDFPFMVKSSAIKILTIRDEEADDLYFALLSLKNAPIERMGHARHYIGIVQSALGSRPELAEQRRISAYFRTLDDLICRYAELTKRLHQIKASCLQLMIV